MSTSQGQEDVYETQNDQRLDELHSKIRTLRGVRFPIFIQYMVTERQRNLSQDNH